MAKRSALTFLSLFLVLGCDDGSTPSAGGDGGIGESRTIGSLSLPEARQICEEFTAAQGAPGSTIDCGGPELTVQSVEDCATGLEASECENTVGELRACMEALDGDGCRLLTAPECQSVVSNCATSSGG